MFRFKLFCCNITFYKAFSHISHHKDEFPNMLLTRINLYYVLDDINHK